MIKRYSQLNKVDQNTLLYHGRHGETPYAEEGIYVTPDKEYAKRYAGDDGLFVFTLNVPEATIFSFRRAVDVNKIKPYFTSSHWQGILSNLNEGELDWAGVGDLANAEYETTEEFLKALGFKGIYITERTGIFSLYIFDEKDLTFVRKET